MALRPFEETAKQIRRGFFLVELAEKLAEVAQAVDATGRQGELNIKLTIYLVRTHTPRLNCRCRSDQLASIH